MPNVKYNATQFDCVAAAIGSSALRGSLPKLNRRHPLVAANYVAPVLHETCHAALGCTKQEV